MKRIILALLLAVAATSGTARAGTVNPPQFTLMMGRAIDGQYADTKCQVPTTSVPLVTTASYLAGFGLRATAPSTLSEVGETTPVCSGRLLYATWPDLQSLRDTYGWDVVPRGATNDVITGETGQALYDDTCGVLPMFYSHGFPDAWGLYAYPQNRFDSTDEATVKTCYGYGRQYGALGRTNKMPLPDPFWQKTISVNGGLCTTTTLACYRDPLVRNQRRYMLPSQLDASVSTLADTWTAVQFYRLVTGSQGTAKTAAGLPAWDCTSADPAQHWSHLPEEYCYTDFQAFVAGLPAGVVDSSPAQVATLYGRSFAVAP